MLYELCTLRHPFDANNQGALIIKIIRGQYPPLPSTYSPKLSQLLDLCLERDTRRRPDSSELLRLPQVVENSAALKICLSGNVAESGGAGGQRPEESQGGRGVSQGLSDEVGCRVKKHGNAGEERRWGGQQAVAPVMRVNQRVQQQGKAAREEELFSQVVAGCVESDVLPAWVQRLEEMAPTLRQRCTKTINNILTNTPPIQQLFPTHCTAMDTNACSLDEHQYIFP